MISADFLLPESEKLKCNGSGSALTIYVFGHREVEVTVV